ncbi:hypothetical protein Nepgr_025055 [Nepenthes gracilis]|uniref:Uncharacterized protein n=1 Tax=Nepenthes gracilis TaxID=150966 RepID=A0AAD3T5S9_NEPGR|nr:hypothetical protein Nepgr_025055 [Nepenthes gracilis]
MIPGWHGCQDNIQRINPIHTGGFLISGKFMNSTLIMKRGKNQARTKPVNGIVLSFALKNDLILAILLRMKPGFKPQYSVSTGGDVRRFHTSRNRGDFMPLDTKKERIKN